MYLSDPYSTAISHTKYPIVMSGTVRLQKLFLSSATTYTKDLA